MIYKLNIKWSLINSLCRPRFYSWRLKERSLYGLGKFVGSTESQNPRSWGGTFCIGFDIYLIENLTFDNNAIITSNQIWFKNLKPVVSILVSRIFF